MLHIDHIFSYSYVSLEVIFISSNLVFAFNVTRRISYVGIYSILSKSIFTNDKIVNIMKFALIISNIQSEQHGPQNTSLEALGLESSVIHKKTATL